MSIHATSTESYTGKNLFDKNNPNLFSGYFDGDIASPTIVSGAANRNRIVFIPCKPNTTYSLSAQSLQGIAQIQVGTTSVMPAAGVSVYNLGYFGNNKTTPNNAKYLLARVQSNVGVDIADVLQDFLDGLQIEIGPTATSYEPYISHFGKNLFNWNYIANSGATFGTNNNNGTVKVDTYGIHYKNPTSADQYFTVNGYGAVEPDAASVMRMYNLSPNTSYTISYTATNYSQVFIRFFNLGGGIVSTLSSSITAAGRVSFSFTVPASAYGYQIRVDNEAYGRGLPSLDNDISSIQIEAGSVATDYEPYVGGVPSPLISDVSHVSTSKNLLNMQSGSNGEYFGTTNQKTYSGKNLAKPYQTTGSVSKNGVTLSMNNDGSITLNGTATGDSWLEFCGGFSDTTSTKTTPVVELDTSSNYTFSYTVLSGSISGSNTFLWIQNNYNPNSETSIAIRTSNPQSITFTGKNGIYRIWVRTYSGVTYNNLVLGVQVESGSAATSYEPYVGGVPSPNPDYPQDVVTGKLASKNIFEAPSSPAEVWQGSYTKITANSLKVKSTVNHPTSTAYARVDITGLNPNTDYYFSYNYERTGGSVSGPTVGGIATRIDGGAISSVTIGGRKINTGPGTYIRFYFYVGQNTSITTSDEVTFSNIQLEKGSTATEFEPYFTPIELTQKDSYQDKVYKSNNGWTLHKEMGETDLATETWTKGGTGGGGAIYMVCSSISNIKYVPNNQTLGSGLAENYTLRVGSGLSGNSAINQIAIDVTRVGVNVGFTEVTPSGLFYYALATPTNTAITDSATIAWLNKYDTDSLPHHKYINTRRTTYVGASGLASAIDLYDGSYASTLPTYSDANDHHLTTANGGTYTVSLQNISAKIVSGTVTFSVFTNQRKIDFSWNGSATSTNVSVSLQADEYIKSIYAYIPQDADAGITLSQQLESGSLTDFEPYYNIVKIYAGNDLVFEDTSLTD